MIINYLKRDLTLSLRNIFVLLIFFFPIITALGASGIADNYSTTPKIVMLEEEKSLYSVPEGVNVYYAGSLKELEAYVYEIDTKIGFYQKELLLDGRESQKSAYLANDLLSGIPIDDKGLSDEVFQKVMAFNLYGSLIFTGIILLFSLVEERANHTTELIKTQPVPPVLPVLSKVLVVGFIIGLDFLICSIILNLPFQIGLWTTVLVVGILLGVILGLTLAFYATNETQALAILKPVSMVFLLAIPGLGFFLGGVMHTIALFTNPFYWLLNLVNGLFREELDLLYLILSLGLSAVVMVLLAMNWHRTPYGVKKYYKST